MYIQLNEDFLLNEDKSLLNNYRRFRDYNVIRLDLVEAYFLINSVIEFKNKIKNLEEDSNKQHFIKEAKLSKSHLHYAIILYTKWFTATKNKPTLKPAKFFRGINEQYLETHNYIIELRNTYIVHNEKELLGLYSVDIHIDSSNEITLSCGGVEQLTIMDPILQKFKECIKIVHNYTVENEIPKYEDHLKKELIEKKIIERLVNNNMNNLL